MTKLSDRTTLLRNKCTVFSFHGRGVGFHRFPARDIAAALSLAPFHPICHADLRAMIQALRPATHYRWHMATSTKSKTAPNGTAFISFTGIIIARSKSKKCCRFVSSYRLQSSYSEQCNSKLSNRLVFYLVHRPP